MAGPKKSAKKKKSGGGAQPPPQPPPRRHEPQRAAGGVPPAEAFDNLPKRKPPNLPGYEAEPAPRQQGRQGAGGQGGRPAQKGGKGAGQGGGRPRPPEEQAREEKPRPPVNPARRRRRRRVTAAVVIVLLIAAGFFITVTALFKIEQFEVEGESPYTLEEIAAVFGHAPGDSMYGFSAAAAEERIVQALPYIETVRVRRKLPSTILFRVQPAAEAYCVAGAEGYAVLSAGRKVLRQTAEKPEGLMEIRGLEEVQLTPGLPLALLAEAGSGAAQTPDSTPAASDSAAPEDTDTSASGSAGTTEAAEAAGGTDAASRFEAMELLLPAMAQAGFESIDWVDVSDPLALAFHWQGRVTVQLGPRGGLEEKLATAWVLLTDESQALVDPGTRGTLDMTYYLTTGQSYFKPA